MYKIALCAGHGDIESEKGVMFSETLNESDIVLEFTLALKTILETNGFEIVLTRSGSVNDLPLFDENVRDVPARISKVLDNNCDFLISFHSNSRNEATELFYSNLLARRLAFAIKGGIFYWRKVDFFDMKSGEETQEVSFFVLNGWKPSVPVLLIELFTPNSEMELELINNAGFKNQMINALAKNIINYFNSI